MKILVLFLIFQFDSKISYGSSDTTDFLNTGEISNLSNDTDFFSTNQYYDLTTEITFYTTNVNNNSETSSSNYSTGSSGNFGSYTENNSGTMTETVSFSQMFEDLNKNFKKDINDQKIGLIVIGIFTGLCFIGLIGLFGLFFYLFRRQKLF